MTGPERLTKWVWNEFRANFRWPKAIDLGELERSFESVVKKGVAGIRRELAKSFSSEVERAKTYVGTVAGDAVDRAKNYVSNVVKRLF